MSINEQYFERLYILEIIWSKANVVLFKKIYKECRQSIQRSNNTLPNCQLHQAISAEECEALPFFHDALAGCDTVSFLSGIGKKTVCNSWKVFN